MYATALRPVFRIGSLMGVDDCCEIGCDRSRDVAMAINFCLLNPRRPNFLCHSDQYVVNFLHSAGLS